MYPSVTRSWLCARLTQVSYAGDITPQECWALLRDNSQAVLVDCRSAAEWEWVGVADLSELGRKVLFVEWNHSNGRHNDNFIEDLRATGLTPAQRPLVFLCRSGKRSAAAAEAATKAGIAPAYNITDGFEGQIDEHMHRGVGGWRAVGMPWKQS